VRVEAPDRKRLEQLCRYITRPALSDERVRLNDAGQVELKLKTPWRDGTTHLVMSPLEFMQRLATAVSTLRSLALRPTARHPRERLLSADQFRPVSVKTGSATADRGRRLSGRSTWGSAVRR
jgi:hypothetical protein